MKPYDRIEKDGVTYEYISGSPKDMGSYRVVAPDYPKRKYGLEDIGRSALSGATLGFADEMAGLVHGGMSLLQLDNPITGYTQARDAYRGAQGEFRQDHPVAATLSEMGGGMGTGLLGGMKAAGTTAAQKIAQLPLWQRAGVASATGAGAGGIVGAGEAESLADVPDAVGRGAAIGAVAGPVFETGVTGMRAVGRQMSPQRAAERSLRRAAKRGDMTLDQVRRKLKKMGPDAVLADVNEGFRGALDTLVNRPGKIRTQAINQLTKRSYKQVDEILDATGQGRYFEVLDNLKTARAEAATPVYTRAYGKGVKHSDELEDLFTGIEEALPGAWREAKKYGKLDLVASGKQIPDLGDARPTLRGWQAIKEYMDDNIGVFLRKGEGQKAGYLIDIKKRLLKELDSQNPDYATARNVWAGSKAFESSMEDGLSFMRRGMSAGKLKATLSKLNESEKLAYREGARQAIQDTMENAGFTHDAAKFFRTPAMTKKLNLLFGRKGAVKILRTIRNSSDKQATLSAVTGNSKTAMRQIAAREDDLKSDILGAATDAITESSPTAGMGLLRRGLNYMPSGREATQDIMGSYLMDPNPLQMLQYLQGSGMPLPPVQGAGLLPPILGGIGGGLMAE